MKSFSLLILAFIVIFEYIYTTSCCVSSASGSSDEHCTEVEDSTPNPEDEGVTFFDQVTNHMAAGERREIENREDFAESLSKWYPDVESPLEEAKTSTPVPEQVKATRNPGSEEATLSAERTRDELQPDGVDGLAFREKKDRAKWDVPDSAGKKEIKSSGRGSSGPTDGELSERTSPTDAVVPTSNTTTKQTLLQGTRGSKKEQIDGARETFGNEFIRKINLHKGLQSNNSEQFNSPEPTTTTDENVLTSINDEAAERTADNKNKGISVGKTEVKIQKETENKEATKTTEGNFNKVDSKVVSIKNNEDAKSTPGTTNAFTQREIFNGSKNISALETELKIRNKIASGEGSDIPAVNEGLAATSTGLEVSVSESSSREPARCSEDVDGSPEPSSGGSAPRRARAETLWEKRSASEDLPGRGVVVPDDGGAEGVQPGSATSAEGDPGESGRQRRTSEQHAEITRRFSADELPVPTAVAQHQRRPSRLSDSPPELSFPAAPEGDSFHIGELGLSDGLFLFSYLGRFLSLLQPSEFPIDLIRDALWNRVSVFSLIMQSLRAEAGFLACLCAGALLAAALPCYVAARACCGGRRPADRDRWGDGSECRRRSLLFVLHVLALFIGLGAGAMFATNEQTAAALGRTPRVLELALADATAFLRGANRQLRAVVTNSLGRALAAASEDLRKSWIIRVALVFSTSGQTLEDITLFDVELLLGEPIQHELAEETGVVVATDTLVDVGAAAAGVAAKAGFTLAHAAETRDLVQEARARLRDLRQQVDSFRRQCPARDRPLCDTVDPAGLDAALRLDQLLGDRRLAELHDLREANLSSLAQQVRAEFHKVPQLVAEQTREARLAVRRQLDRRRAQAEDDAWALDAVARDLAAAVEAARDKALLLVRGLADVERWRWLAGLGASICVLALWLLMVAGLLCGCCGAPRQAAPVLLASAVATSLLSVALWLVALAALAAGGHGEVFVCRPLYDEPGFPALAGLLDRPGVLFRRPGGGFLSGLLYGNDTLDVPLQEVLTECRDNRPAYPTFRLRTVYDVGAAADHRTWDPLHEELSRLRVDLTGLQLLTPELQRQLAGLVASSAVNLTAHRLQLSRPVTGKDLSSFADQLESVANQIKDLATASRLETLASRTRRLLVSHVQPLEQRKEDLVYQLTALEVQMQPLQRQVNQSLSHLKTIQYFINNQGDSICKQKTKEYARRLLGYADQCRDHVLAATGERLAPCRPLWDVFHALRQLLCRHILDPLNGFWFSCVCCLLLFLVACPLCLKLADLCRDGGLMQPGSSERLQAKPHCPIRPDHLGRVYFHARWLGPSRSPPEESRRVLALIGSKPVGLSSPSEALMMPESNTWASNNRPVESDGW